MLRKIVVLLVTAVVALTVALPVYAQGATPADPPPKFGRNQETLGVIYVTGQQLYYDTFVPVQKLPWNGNDESFQPLYDGVTPYGPGDPGYKGGRWWIDSNPNGYQDAGDTFLLCPLFGPGRAEP